MPNRALRTARTVTVTAVSAGALATAVLGVHLATDHAAAQAAGTTLGTTGSGGQQLTSPQDGTQEQAQPQQQVQPQQQEGGSSGGFFGFGQVQPPSGGSRGGGHSGSGGS